IFNAVDALPRGGSIRLTGCRKLDRVVIEVRDTGPGIPADIQPRIFDPFFTTKGEGGTGLGLPQVLSIVERHAGTVDVESSHHGSTFRLSLPASDAAAVALRMGGVVDRPLLAARSIRVLVIEDEQRLARMASLVLKQHGHRAVVAASGEDAIAMLEEEQDAFELVISDLGLGAGKNGWDLADFVRERCP